MVMCEVNETKMKPEKMRVNEGNMGGRREGMK